MPKRNSAGVDWAKEEHAVCVVDEAGRFLSERRFAHDERGLRELCRSLVRRGVERVAIERPEGILVERLLEAGLVVLAVHPNQLKAARPRFRAAGGKSDGFDAFVLAELARTDHHRFRALAPDSDETKALKALTRAREDLVQTRVALANQLRAELEAFWPGAARVFADVDSPIALAFLERYPSPADARSLGEKRLSGFLARHGYCGRRPLPDLLARLREAPAGTAGELEVEARRTVVLALVAALRPLVEQIKLLGSQIAGAVRAHPDGEVFLSLFRSPKSTITAARLVAEIGDCRGRYPTAEAMAADAGMSPVAVESGKRKVASFRRACDKRLRDAVATLADATRHHNPWAKDLYRRAISRGHDHPHAIRVLGRAWVRVIWRMWQDNAPYDPARHGGLRRLNTVRG
ncbi:MAG: IS110 family transposase [Actinomycetota bacterium]|nr:IS110 family transposase [Actinomycetota bacterium]